MRQILSFIIALFLTILASPSFAKNNLPELKPFKEKNVGQVIKPMMKKDKWGYVNSEGKFLIKAEFDGAKEYVDGLAFVKFAGKWGVINAIPAYVVTPAYDEINDFQGEIAIVSNEGKYGIIDKKGAVRLPVEYDEIRSNDYFSHILFAKKEGLWDFVDTMTGMVKYKLGYSDIITNDGPYAKVKKDGKWGLMNNEVKYVSPVDYQQIKYNTEGYYIVQKDGLYGAMNLKGEYIMPCELAQEPLLNSEVKAFFAKDRVYLTSTKEKHSWTITRDFNDPQLANLAITQSSLLVEQPLDAQTKLVIYDNLPAYITHKDICVWAANDNIMSKVNSPLSMDYKEDSIQLTNYFRANKNAETYSMEQEIDIRYPSSASDFRVSIAKIQKTLFNLCTKQELATAAKVSEYYIGGYHIGYCPDYDWVAIVQNQVSLAKNQWKSSLHVNILSVDKGVMRIRVQKKLDFGDAEPNIESTEYSIDMKTGELLSK